MAAPKIFPIKESEKEIRLLMKKSIPLLSKRLHALLILKQHEKPGISKREVAEQIGVNHNSIQTWRSAYIKGGMEQMLSHEKTGYKPVIHNKNRLLTKTRTYSFDNTAN